MRILAFYSSPRITWIRFFGHGISFRNKNYLRFSSTFSERNGYTKYLDFLGYRIIYLKPSSHPKQSK